MTSDQVEARLKELAAMWQTKLNAKVKKGGTDEQILLVQSMLLVAHANLTQIVGPLVAAQSLEIGAALMRQREAEIAAAGARPVETHEAPVTRH